MATTEYKTATSSPRNAQTPINRASGDRNEVSSVNGATAIWIIVAIVALAAIAFAMGAFGPSDDAVDSGTMATESYAPGDSTATTTNPMSSSESSTTTTAPMDNSAAPAGTSTMTSEPATAPAE